MIKRMLAEQGVEAERALAVLIETLVRDHVKHSTGALNDPTILWQVEKALWEARAAGAAKGGADAAKDADVLGILSMLLMTCRESGEDRAAAAKKTAEQRPTMRIVKD